jgi:Protein of unknown function (DUF2934)
VDNTLERRIRERAYEIWNATGRPHGEAEQHWLIAEREVLAMLISQPSSSTAGTGRASRSRSKRKARAVA